MGSGMVFQHKYKVKSANNIGTALASQAYPASGSYIDVSAAERVTVLIRLGVLADAIAFEIKASDANDGTLDSVDATNLKHTCANTDDNEFIAFDIEVRKLPSDHHFLAVVVTGVSGSNYADIQLLMAEDFLPVTQDDSVLPVASQYIYAG